MLRAVIGKELTSRLQGRLAFVILTLLVAAFTGLVIAGFWMIVLNVPTLIPAIGTSTGAGAPSVTIQSLVASSRGVFLFVTLSICSAAAVLAVAPAVASSALSSEREAGTHDLLLGTGMPASALIFGKLVGAVAFVLLMSLTTVPGFAIAWMFGGVSPRDALMALALLLSTVLFISACGILISSLVQSSVLASLYCYGIAFMLGYGTLLLYVVGASIQNEAIVRPVLAFNPFVALATIPDQLAGQVAQTMPFQYRAMLDLSSQEYLGMSLKYPRWINTLSVYLIGTIVMAGMATIAADPCHRLRPRSGPGRE